MCPNFQDMRMGYDRGYVTVIAPYGRIRHAAVHAHRVSMRDIFSLLSNAHVKYYHKVVTYHKCALISKICQSCAHGSVSVKFTRNSQVTCVVNHVDGFGFA